MDLLDLYDWAADTEVKTCKHEGERKNGICLGCGKEV